MSYSDLPAAGGSGMVKAMHGSTAPLDTPDARRRFFRVLHETDATTRRALVLLARGHTLHEVGRQLGVHPAFIKRRLSTLAATLTG